MSTPSPDFQNALVPEAKVLDYLLNFEKMPGAAKARFFASFGFRRNNWTVFADALRKQACEGVISAEFRTVYGTKIEVVGQICSPDGRDPKICTVWQRDEDNLEPRLITAYPLKL
jgi:hypothetical protein